MRCDTEAFHDRLSEQGVLVEKIMLIGQSHTTLILPKALIDFEKDKDPAEIIADLIIKHVLD